MITIRKLSQIRGSEQTDQDFITSLIQSWEKQVKSISEGASRIYRRILAFAKMDARSAFDQRKIVLLATNATGVQGFLIGKIQNGSLVVDELATAPGNFFPSQSREPVKGVGRALMEQARREAKSQRLHSVTLRYFEEAKGFYQRLGMTQTEHGFSWLIENHE